MAFPLFCPLWPRPGPLPVLLPLPAVPCLGLVSPTRPSDPQGSCSHLQEEARPCQSQPGFACPLDTVVVTVPIHSGQCGLRFIQHHPGILPRVSSDPGQRAKGKVLQKTGPHFRSQSQVLGPPGYLYF